VDWNDLRFLLAVHEGGSVSAAARRLRADQATVSRRLQALQRAVGARLLERTAKGTRLTGAGARALETARSFADAADALERELAGADRRLSGTVRITAPWAIASRLLAPPLAAFHQAHPSLQLELIAATQALNLSRREAELAVRMFRPEEPSLAVRRLGRMAIALYASGEYVRRRGRPSPSSLAGHTLVGQDASQGEAERRWMERAAPRTPPVLLSNSREVLLHAVRGGLGVATLPCYLADAERDLVRLSGPILELEREIWLVVHRDLQRAPRVRAGIDFLVGALEAAASRLRGKED